MGAIFPFYPITGIDNIPQEMSDTANGLEG